MIDKTYSELAQEYQLMKRERDVANEVLRKCIHDCRVNGFYSPIDASEFGVRAQARIVTLERVILSMLEDYIGDQKESLDKVLRDKSWRKAPIVEHTVSFEDDQ